MGSYLGVQRQQQERNSSSNVRADFYLQPIFEHVILKDTKKNHRRQYDTLREKKSSPGEIFH